MDTYGTQSGCHPFAEDFKIIKKEEKTCECCVKFLLCKKVKNLDKLPPICAKFEDNFPEYVDDVDDVDVEPIDEITEVAEVKLYRCNHVTESCMECPHAKPHDAVHDDWADDCYKDQECWNDAGGHCTVRCVPIVR